MEDPGYSSAVNIRTNISWEKITAVIRKTLTDK